VPTEGSVVADQRPSATLFGAAQDAVPAGPRSPLRHSLRPRLTAVAPTTADVIRHAGGWLLDQVLAGWDVTVITADRPDSVPLRILGVRHRDLDIMTSAPVLGPCLEAVAVRSDLFAGDERVRRMVLAAAGTGRADIRLWGEVWPEDFEENACPVSHQLSLAALAFKAKALAAAGVTAEPAATEVFRRGEVRYPVPVH
jgi:hypothetical protein